MFLPCIDFSGLPYPSYYDLDFLDLLDFLLFSGVSALLPEAPLIMLIFLATLSLRLRLLFSDF